MQTHSLSQFDETIPGRVSSFWTYLQGPSRLVNMVVAMCLLKFACYFVIYCARFMIFAFPRAYDSIIVI